MINEVEWIPMRGLANDLSWGKERSTAALVNYVPHMQKEERRIAKLRVRRVVSSPDDDTSMTSMEEEEESQLSDAPSMSLQTDTDCEADEESEGDVSGQKSAEEGVEASRCIDQHWHGQNWESITKESEGLAFDDPRSGSDTTVTGVDSPSVSLSSPRDKSGDSLPTMSRGSAPCSQRSPMEAGQRLPLTATVTMLASSADAVEVHVSNSELDNL